MTSLTYKFQLDWQGTYVSKENSECWLIWYLPRCTEFFPQILHIEAVSKDGGHVLLTVCDTSSIHCLMQIFTAFFFIFWCLHASVYVTSEKPSNDKPSLKDLESLFDSKLKPIHSRLDDLFKKVDDNYKALQARLDSLEARNVSLEAESANLEWTQWKIQVLYF